MVEIRGRSATFRFLRPSASEACLFGEFIPGGGVPMRRAADGCWTVTLRLSPGSFRFRYLADGQWFNDYAAFGLAHGPFGLESLVWMPEQSVSRPRPTARQGRVASRGGFGAPRRAGVLARAAG